MFNGKKAKEKHVVNISSSAYRNDSKGFTFFPFSPWPKQSSCSDFFRLNLAIGTCLPQLQPSLPIFISPYI